MNLSLVMTIQDEGDVVLDYFHWARTPAKWGWASRALQDRSNCIKFTPTCRTLGQPLIDLRSLLLSGKSKVLWAGIGIRMDKLVRHKIPSNVMHLKKMYSAMSGIALEVRCFFCDANATAQSTLQTCPACMCTMHPQCARTSLPNVVQQGPLPRLACPYPSNWSLCPLCALASVSMWMFSAMVCGGDACRNLYYKCWRQVIFHMQTCILWVRWVLHVCNCEYTTQVLALMCIFHLMCM